MRLSPANRHIQRASHTGQHIYGFFAKKKDAYRCCYRNGRKIKTLSRECSTLLQPDISESALRELEDELGIHATPEQLHFAGTFPISFAKEFHGKMYRDEELAFVYIYDQPVDITELILQKEEVEAVEWFDLEKTYEECKYCRDTFCVPSGGFEVVRKYLRENQ